ncbi:MAG: hypothetical protein ACSHW7_02095 [Patiriisocius sp.]|uniref:hypothetical protein n=1 Tax=Patiriisocius sp. TaxID=2822396 RepID=UPI003EFACD65
MKNILKLLFLTLAILVTSSSMAQAGWKVFAPNEYWQGQIKLVDGTIKEGFVRVPKSCREKKISFLKNEDSKREKIKSEDIEALLLTSNQGNSYLFENVHWRYMFRNKTTKKKLLLLVEAKNDFATFYKSSQYYFVNYTDGILDLAYNSNTGDINYLIRKNKNDFATHYYTRGQAGHFKKKIAEFLDEAPVTVKKVQDKELKREDRVEIVKQYLLETDGM